MQKLTIISKISLLICFFVLSVSRLHGQKVFVPDTAFVSFLCEEWAFTMNPTCDSIDRSLSGSALGSGTMDFSSRNVNEINLMYAYSALDTVIGANNNITFLPFFPNSIDYIDFSGNKLTHSNSNHLGITIDLTYYDVSNNIFSRLPNLENAKPKLEILKVNDNYLSDLPDLTDFVKLRELDVSNNRLTFDDLITISGLPNFDENNFKILPQKKRDFEENYFVKIEGEDFLFQLDFDGSITTNTYEWYKDGSLIATTNENRLSIEDLTLNDEGDYNVIIKNSGPLFSSYQIEFYNTFKIDVFPDASKIVPSINTSCNVHEVKIEAAFLATFSETELNLRDNSTSEIYELEDTNFLVFESGMYDLIQLNSDTIVQVVSNWISLDNFPKCSKTVSPNGDNNHDTYFFEYKGNIKVYNNAGLVVRELQGPFHWDVTDENGAFLVGGLYFVEYDDNSSETLTVIR